MGKKRERKREREKKERKRERESEKERERRRERERESDRGRERAVYSLLYLYRSGEGVFRECTFNWDKDIRYLYPEKEAASPCSRQYDAKFS